MAVNIVPHELFLMHFFTNALLFRRSSLQLCRSFSTGKVIMDAGKRAAARYAVDNFVKVSFHSIVLTFGRANETIQLCIMIDMV